MRILLAFIFLFSQTTWGQVSNKTAEFNYVWGADYYTNWVLNPGANLNLSNTTTSNATLTRDTTTKLNNVASFNLDTSANSGYVEFTLGTVVAPATAGNCEFKGIYLGDASLLSAQVLDGSSNVLASAALQNSSTNWQTFSVYYPCAASGSRKVRITQTTAGTTAAINLGKLYYGQQTDVGAGVPNNTFSAKVSSAGVVSDENQDWINGNCSMASSVATCTFNTSQFTAAPNCTVSVIQSGAYVSVLNAATSTTSLSVNTFGTVGGTGSAGNFHIICTRSSTDWIQPTISAPNWDTDWQSYTLTIGAVTTPPTQGAGATKNAWWRRVGDSMEIQFNYLQTAAGSGGTGTYLFPIPSGYTIDTSKVTLSTNGSGAGGTVVGVAQVTSTTAAASLTAQNGVLIPYNTTNLAIYVGAYNGTGEQNNPMSSTNFGLGNTTISAGYTIKVPITGWTKTLSAPMLVGSVTSNATGAMRIESASFNCTGASSLNSQTSNAFASIGNVSSGACTLSFTSGAFSSAPYCTMNVVSSSVGVMGNIATAITTSSVVTQCVTTAAGCANYSGYITCIGPR